jgi:GNAT superfamily N-acetyltransferase
MSAMSLFRLTELSPSEVLDVYAGIAAADPPGVGPRNFKPLQLAVRDESGILIAGLDGGTAWRWLHVYALWVAAPYRRQRLGTRLMDAAESEARERGCDHAMLSTFDFQARGFYERRGYAVWGELDGYPAGHSHLYLRKPLISVPHACWADEPPSASGPGSDLPPGEAGHGQRGTEMPRKGER